MGSKNLLELTKTETKQTIKKQFKNSVRKVVWQQGTILWQDNPEEIIIFHTFKDEHNTVILFSL